MNENNELEECPNQRNEEEKVEKKKQNSFVRLLLEVSLVIYLKMASRSQ